MGVSAGLTIFNKSNAKMLLSMQIMRRADGSIAEVNADGRTKVKPSGTPDSLPNTSTVL
jgi:hypothetical protein